MWEVISKVMAVFLFIVMITFMINHGMIDFSGVDWVTNKTKDAVNSKEGQELIQEFKDISVDVAFEMTDELKKLIATNKQSKTRTEVSLEYVIDGDTLIVSINGEEAKVRLIGLDTPESVHRDETRNNEYGKMASNHTKELLKDIDTLYLEFDEDVEDPYGRILAYVWLTDSTKNTTDMVKQQMLNAIILEDGYAKDKVFEPNTRYASILRSICEEAQENKTGLWAYDEFVALWAKAGIPLLYPVFKKAA